MSEWHVAFLRTRGGRLDYYKRVVTPQTKVLIQFSDCAPSPSQIILLRRSTLSERQISWSVSIPMGFSALVVSSALAAAQRQ